MFPRSAAMVVSTPCRGFTTAPSTTDVLPGGLKVRRRTDALHTQLTAANADLSKPKVTDTPELRYFTVRWCKRLPRQQFKKAVSVDLAGTLRRGGGRAEQLDPAVERPNAMAPSQGHQLDSSPPSSGSAGGNPGAVGRIGDPPLLTAVDDEDLRDGRILAGG